MTVDLSEFQDEPQVCSIARHVAAMDDEDRAKFQAALMIEGITNRKIVERLAVRGIRVDPVSVSSHRKGTCRCVR